ncbi:amino acid ABC transporter permease [Actinomadura madurae]|uniref:amino acid ABC transporter permease n=1 Tax=Actinomadura madurae TaxID=1993 RepID=UPI002026201A|nr:amino acid ABC transporter permease [Actinomadura madurae]MCP9955933.1 amino acid ABC transporter permease [Actinomadura madurae]MCP9955983.1 amino acid ABC transporter permease [Actinomadura madurae]MCP9972747.1 amino acid ABC transporter permease [Actinomadura madurae]MCP9985179.1 amino acid ABC transporter permease [Actinomadura madurae]MCP9985241.1 amino acid ABC transporter permease [Actinomadura madurae]
MTLTKEQSRDTVADVDVAGAAHVRHPLRWVASLVVLVLAAQFAHLLWTNDNFQWDVVGRYMNASIIGDGIAITIELTVIAMAVGIAGGVLLAVGRLSDNPLLRTACGLYVWFFRGVPVLVQLVIWYNLSALMPRLSVGIPFGPEFLHGDTNHLITPLIAAILGLGLNEAAYMAEIIRGGLLAVDPGQTEAAQALGMGGARTFRRIVLPQAMRFIIPPTGSQVINMLKATSLVSVIALADLLYTVQSIYNRTFQTIPLLLVACLWYLVITSILYVGQSFIEHHYSRGATRNARQGFWDFVLMRRRRPAPEVSP